MTIFIGLDGEMSHNDIDDGAALIQLGLSAKTFDGEILNTSALMRPGFNFKWDETAAAVHNIPLSDVLTAPMSYEEADVFFAHWLSDLGCRASKRQDTVVVGFGVGNFDIPFVRKFLPDTFRMFSRRYLELNSLIYLVSELTNEKFSKVKDDLIESAVQQIGYDKAHDAGWDAMMHLLVWEKVCGIIKPV